MAYLPQTPLRQQHQRATQHARRQSWAGHLHPSAVTPSYLNPYHHTNGVLPYVWASTPTFSVPRPLGMPLQQSPLFLSGAATSAIMQPATYAHLQNAPAKHHRRSFSVASPGLHHRPNPGPGGPLMPLSSRGTFGLEQSTSASRPGRRPLHSRSQSTSSLRSLHSFQQGGPSLLGGNLPAQTRLQRAMDWTPRILPDKLPEFKQVRLTPDMVRDKHNGYTYLMSLQSASPAARSHATEYLIQLYAAFVDKRSEGNRMDRSSLQRHRSLLRPNHAEHPVKLHMDTRTFAGHITFKDSSSLWWRTRWTPASASSTGTWPAFEALIAAPFQEQNIGVLERFCFRTAKRLAEMAEDLAGGPPVATHDGKDRGICRAIPMLLFWKLNLQWTQWGLKILETRTTRNSRNVRYLNRQAIVPGCIVFMKRVKMKHVHLDPYGRISRTSDYEVDGKQGHIAIVAGCGMPDTPQESASGVMGSRNGARNINGSTLRFPYGYANHPQEHFDPSALGYLKIVEQSRGEAGSPPITPRTVLLDMSTFRAGEMTIYLPIMQANYAGKKDIGKLYPPADGRAWTYLAGLQPETPYDPLSASGLGPRRPQVPLHLETGRSVSAPSSPGIFRSMSRIFA